MTLAQRKKLANAAIVVAEVWRAFFVQFANYGLGL